MSYFGFLMNEWEKQQEEYDRLEAEELEDAEPECEPEEPEADFYDGRFDYCPSVFDRI